MIDVLSKATPVEFFEDIRLFVKREDLSCRPPGPPFSKMRGVISHVERKAEEGFKIFGALDTYHSQAGHAVAYACSLLGLKCVNYYPEYVGEPGHRAPQERARELGAELHPLKAGMSAVLWNIARRDCVANRGGYMMPNALKLPESVVETAAEVVRTVEHADRERYSRLRGATWITSASSGTITSGVVRGLATIFGDYTPQLVAHLGYSRSERKLREYVYRSAVPEGSDQDLELRIGNIVDGMKIVDEGYNYKDKVRPGFGVPPWPCNAHYDAKAYRWWLAEGRDEARSRNLTGEGLLWNVG